MRGKQAPKRVIAPDVRYKSTQVAKFINYVMERGKKSVAVGIVYDAFDYIEKKTGEPGYDVFLKAIAKISPELEVRAKRIGGANYQVPIEVRPERRFTLACRWLLEAAGNRTGKPMREKLALELIDASHEEGSAFKKKEDVHRMAESNRAFAHFA
ncbi:MAG: 30S ribosomal protein S7 [Candidatus Kerfeldbacteria bacterium RIFOXYA2_FULL_38_24]|uniref:Small ribosomal subunit protein uS7 n=1 Tax=Candidatus Kerfeldbacteria bacterium RIFOXYB2_FULL_38_14 TaxID=1798547 RepID=A0A1G2BF06_9BACT|nr:MAG: 30S ribosomal protein S7 [Candidatus Kerfeldbacteria bacterium RIFOXYB2_FULL_38_14]OGY87922.1 MAG: 30S ribosomal protein S7 [Candidatus Kerfeldbacteria bacterium RIFOXYA2_FULL_38_24]OGY88664.1 MAG: 30S ribosomal protein S7 [Candidatus Kerfeldbacteria bacterium RIFOXYC2_FULL_38_9]